MVIAGCRHTERVENLCYALPPGHPRLPPPRSPPPPALPSSPPIRALVTPVPGELAPSLYFVSHALHIKRSTCSILSAENQATLHFPPAFWGMLLPVTVHGRVSDIWRSYFTQALLPSTGAITVFAPAWVTQVSFGRQRLSRTLGGNPTVVVGWRCRRL